MASPPDLPTLRKRIGELLRSLHTLVYEMLRTKVLLRGSVYELQTRCGKPNCVCTRGGLHRRWVLTERREGRKRLRVVPRGEEERWRRWAGNYRDFRRHRREFIQISGRILEELDEAERLLRRETGE